VLAILLTQHTYFNLDAYKNPETPLIWNHTLHLPYSKRYLEADQNALPTGNILTAEPDSINDFASKPGMLLGHARHLPGFSGNCGADGACEGYNGYWLIEDAPKDAVVLTLGSAFSGVKAELRTDQPGVVLYSCNWMDGSAPVKSTQGLTADQKVVRSSCIAIEAQDYPDGINQYVNPNTENMLACWKSEGAFADNEYLAPNGTVLASSSLDLATGTAGRALGLSVPSNCRVSCIFEDAACYPQSQCRDCVANRRGKTGQMSVCKVTVDAFWKPPPQSATWSPNKSSICRINICNFGSKEIHEWQRLFSHR